MGGIALRSGNWAWWKYYERWREGGRLSRLQRKWLSVSLAWISLEASGKKMTLALIRSTPLWPEERS